MTGVAQQPKKRLDHIRKHRNTSPGVGGGGYSHTLPIGVCATQRGRDFEAPDLERGIHFRGVCAIIGGETKSGGQVYIQGYTI